MKLKRNLAFILSVVLAVGGCVVPAAAQVKAPDQGTEVVTQAEEEITPRAEYISHYTEQIPAGTSSGDYSTLIGSRSGNLEWEGAAANLTMSGLKLIVRVSLDGASTAVFDELTKSLDNLQYAFEQYAPNSSEMDYHRVTYKNTKASTSTSEYYMHKLRYTLTTGQNVYVTLYEIKSWV